eukprot:gene11327-biopygen12779
MLSRHKNSLNGALQVNKHGQPIMNPATWKLKLIHFYELVKTGLALALKVTPLDAKEEYEKFDCYDNAGLLYPMPRILMSEFTKKYEKFDIRAGQPHYREAMAKVAKLLDRMAPTLKENFGSYKDVTPLGCWAIAKLYNLDQDQHTLERLSGIAQTEASKRDDMTAQGMLLCVSKPPTQRPTVMPRQTPAFPVTQDPSALKGKTGEPKSSTNPRYKGKNPRPFPAGNPGNNNQGSMAGTGGGYQGGYQGNNQGTQGGYQAGYQGNNQGTQEAETQASSQAIYKPTFDPSTDGTGSTAAIPRPSARVSRHVTQAQHRASQDLLMDEMTVLRRDLDLMFREVQNLHEFNMALQVRATAVETAQRAACVTHNPVDTFVRDYTASGQLSPSTATLLQGTEPSYGVPYLANLSHQHGLSFKSATGLLQCVNLMVLVDTGSGLNFISQSMADSLGHDPLPCHHKTIAFNDVKSSLTKEIQMPVIFCSDTPNEISVRATFVIAPDNTIFDALIGTPLMAMPGISALPDISQEKLTLRPFLHLSSAEHTATGRALTVDLPFRPGSWTSLAYRRELTGSFAPSRKRLAAHLSMHVSTERHSSGAYIDTTSSNDIFNNVQHIRARGSHLDWFSQRTTLFDLPSASMLDALSRPHSTGFGTLETWVYRNPLHVHYYGTYKLHMQSRNIPAYYFQDEPVNNTLAARFFLLFSDVQQALMDSLHIPFAAIHSRDWTVAEVLQPYLTALTTSEVHRSTVPSDYLNYLLVLPPTATSFFSIRSYPRDYRTPSQPPTWAPNETPCRVNSSTALNNVMQYRNILSAAVEHILSHQPNHSAAGDNPRHDPHPAFCTALLISAAALVTTWVHLHPPRVPCTVPREYIRSSPTGHNLDGRRENLLTTHHLTPTDDHNLLASSSRWRQVIQPRTERYLTDMAASYPVNRENSRFASLVVRAVHNHTVVMFNPLSETDTPIQNLASYREHVAAAGDGQVPPFEGPPTHPTESIIWNKYGQTAPIDLMMDILRFFPHLRRHTPFSMSSIRFSHPNWSAFYVTLLMHMVTHAHSMDSYSYETNSDNTLYLGDVNLLHRIQKTSSATNPAASIGQEFLDGQAAVYQASTSCALPVHLDPSTPASLLPGRLQGGLTSCLSHMDPNYLQEGGINNSMPDGAVTPNAERGALHPDCDLFIGHHRDGTEAQRKEMAAMLNRMTPAVARTMEDLREGYKGIVPPMHIEKDNDKQAFTSPYRKPPIEKLAQDKVCAELLLLGFIEPAPSAQHAANPVVALKKGHDGQYTANRVCYNYKAINLLTKDMHTGAQHGNADALSRFPSPTAEDNTGARIDLASDLYAAFPTVPTTPYVPLELTLGHIVDYILDVRSVLSICTTPLSAAVTYMAQNVCRIGSSTAQWHPTPSPPLAPGRQLDTDLHLAAMSKDTDGLDIHSDQFVLEYLRRGVLGSNWTTSRTRRVLARGNTMLMHAVEYFSAALVVVPIPAKEAIHMVYAHSHGVLAHFGAYALCISDNGPEFQGKFKEHLLHNFIDHRTIHPNHPQGNGFVERSVGTIKAALTKICSENLATDTWDIDIAKVVTAYNCSPQETTKCAPFTLLYARAPMAAQGKILRIIDLKPTEVVVLQGRCVPVEDWFCPNCKASGITAIPAGRIPEAPQKEPNLFPTPQTRSRDRAALACDKMLVIKQVGVQGGLDKAVWGTASFQGPLSRPW